MTSILMKKYFVYILSCSDGSYYTGVTNDVLLRVDQHNQGLDSRAFTFSRRPVKLVWHAEFLNPVEAISREKQIKGWNRKKKEALIEGNYDLLPELSMSSLRQAQTDNNQILNLLPYSPPFLFVDKIIHINNFGCEGTYTFKQNHDFYKGHFKDFPVTPGVILTECCAQIGLVCLGIFLLGLEEGGMDGNRLQIAMSSNEMEFLLPVYPGETVTVVSEKMYFRFGKLKCKVKMHNEKGGLICKGTISGMFKIPSNEN